MINLLNLDKKYFIIYIYLDVKVLFYISLNNVDITYELFNFFI